MAPPAITDLATDALHAIRSVRERLDLMATPNSPIVLGAGIDAPLFWSNRGYREIDDILDMDMANTGFPRPGGRGRIVQSVNSLRGACLVQGPLLVRHLTCAYDGLQITESHPKVFDRLLRHSGQPELLAMAEALTNNLREHQMDATLCAVAAWAMLHCQNSPQWRNLYLQESDPITPFEIPVSYWMPIPQAIEGR